MSVSKVLLSNPEYDYHILWHHTKPGAVCPFRITQPKRYCGVVVHRICCVHTCVYNYTCWHVHMCMSVYMSRICVFVSKIYKKKRICADTNLCILQNIRQIRRLNGQQRALSVRQAKSFGLPGNRFQCLPFGRPHTHTYRAWFPTRFHQPPCTQTTYALNTDNVNLNYFRCIMLL